MVTIRLVLPIVATWTRTHFISFINLLSSEVSFANNAPTAIATLPACGFRHMVNGRDNRVIVSPELFPYSKRETYHQGIEP